MFIWWFWWTKNIVLASICHFYEFWNVYPEVNLCENFSNAIETLSRNIDENVSYIYMKHVCVSRSIQSDVIYLCCFPIIRHLECHLFKFLTFESVYTGARVMDHAGALVRMCWLRFVCMSATMPLMPHSCCNKWLEIVFIHLYVYIRRCCNPQIWLHVSMCENLHIKVYAFMFVEEKQREEEREIDEFCSSGSLSEEHCKHPYYM